MTPQQLPLLQIEPFAADRPRLLSRFPGTKCPHLYPVHDSGDYDCWMAPYAGSGEQEAWLAQRYPRLPVYASDVDPAVKAPWRCWHDAGLRQRVRARVQEWQQQILADSDRGWPQMRGTFDRYAQRGGPNYLVEMAAVSIVIRRLVFSGIIRCSKETGNLNIALNQGDLERLGRWEFHWPKPPRHLCFADSWRDLIKRFARSRFNRAIVLVDPPYWAPGHCPRVNGGMSPCYPGHVPNDPSTYTDFLELMDWLLSSGRVARVVATNYWGQVINAQVKDKQLVGGDVVEWPIRGDMEAMAMRHGWEMAFSHNKILDQGNKGVDSVAFRLEGVWEFGGRRQFTDKPIFALVEVEQLSVIGT